MSKKGTLMAKTFFDAGEGAANDDRVFSRVASKSGQSEGDTEDDPVGPMTPSSNTEIATTSTPVVEKTSRKTRAVSFLHAPRPRPQMEVILTTKNR
jgi:hypothetical protein